MGGVKGLLGCVVVVCLVNERIAKTRKNVVDKEEVLNNLYETRDGG